MQLDVTTESTDPQRTVLRVVGSIDIASRDRLTAAAAQAVSDAIPELVLDVAGVTFMDSTGIGALINLAGDLNDAGGRLVLRRPSHAVRRILEVAGLADQWIVDDDPVI